MPFEALVAEIAAAFVNLPATEVDSAIVDSLRRIVEALELDRAVLFLRQPDGDDAFPEHRWGRPGVPIQSERFSVRAAFPWFLDRVLEDGRITYERLSDIPDATTRASVQKFGAKSGAIVGFSIGGRIAGLIAFASIRAERLWPETLMARLALVANVFAGAIVRKRHDESMAGALGEIKRLSDRLHDENAYLRREVNHALGAGPQVVGQSAAMLAVMAQVQQVAPTDATVLLLGETGVGKEVIATQLHELSERGDRVMVRINCAAIPAALIESELFGREKGAYTGALTRQTGRFELAHRSTIFLDEIGDLPLDVQVKLLRVLEDRYVERLGGAGPIKIDVRVIAATHRNLEEMVRQGTFREDLYYRLNVFPLRVPPLRERPEDLPVLVWRFVEEFSARFGKIVDGIDRASMAELERYPWPGNVRELRNIVERAMIVARPGRLTIPLPQTGQAPAAGGASRPSAATKLVDVETAHIIRVLESAAWRVRGKGGAAERLGLKPSTLETRMAKLGIRRPPRA